MIVVLADDLSGAAELAAIAVQHGLTAEVQTHFAADSCADVLCIDSDTRLLPPADAAERIHTLASAVGAAKPAWIFKKCDSVLRGSVLAEARALAQTAGLAQLLLIPANPTRGRIIRHGAYFIDGSPLHQTVFARDPHHPRSTPRVADLLPGDLSGVRIPDILEAGDIRREARAMDATTLPVGAADFFRTLLEQRIPSKPPAPPLPALVGRTLLVCGSAAAWPQRVREARAAGVGVHDLHTDREGVAQSLNATGMALLGIGEHAATRDQLPGALTAQLATTVARLLEVARPDQLLQEGGETASATLRQLGWSRLQVVGLESDLGALAPVGIAAAPRVWIKPGSYAWPAGLWPSRRS